MHIEDQITSFELAKKLKKIGMEQESLWYWLCRVYFDSTSLKSLLWVKSYKLTMGGEL